MFLMVTPRIVHSTSSDAPSKQNHTFEGGTLPGRTRLCKSKVRGWKDSL